MALTFPANPTNGQIYDQYVYDATAQTWRVYGSDTGITNVLATKANLSGGNTFSGNQVFNNYVSKPGVPSFHAYCNANNVSYAAGKIPFDATFYNIGNNFNTATNTFTAPIAGRYLFTVGLFMHTSYANTTNAYFTFNKNGAGYSGNMSHGVNGSDGSQVHTMTIDLAANDTVYYSCNNTYVTWGTATYFTGHFLG